eukprot:gb/GECG01012102.1/.p1 GENE.gb/GECG01012102.1/~~gb/GECG01012102.1/.p1  ORF type:complete len:1571 (+),score=189.89 gb/GECG01012102.1/:1-4713(+)
MTSLVQAHSATSTTNEERGHAASSFSFLAPGKSSRVLMFIRGIISALLASLWNLQFSSSSNEALTGAMVGVYASWIVEHTLGMTLRRAYLGSLGAVASGFTAWISMHSCGTDPICITSSIIIISLLAALLPVNGSIQNIWIAFHAGTLTATLFEGANTSPAVAWAPTGASLVGAVCAIVAAMIPFPHWSISEVRERLQIVSQMYEALQKMTSGAFTREMLRPDGGEQPGAQNARHHTTDEVGIFSQASKTQQVQTNIAVKPAKQPLMGMGSLSSALSWQERSPLIHASIDFVGSMLDTNMERISWELNTGSPWEGPGVMRRFHQLARTVLPRLGESLRNTFGECRKRTLLCHNDRSTASMDKESTNASSQQLQGKDDAVTSDDFSTLIHSESLLDQERLKLEERSITAYRDGYRSGDGRRSILETLRSWHETLARLRQMVLLMGEAQKETDFVASLRENATSSLYDPLVRTIDCSVALLQQSLQVSLEDIRWRGGETYLGSIFGIGGFIPFSVSPELDKELRSAQDPEALANELSYDGRLPSYTKDENGVLIPAVHKPGTSSKRKLLYNLRSLLLKQLRNLTRSYGRARVKVLYSDHSDEAFRPVPMIQRQFKLHPPPMGTIEDETPDEAEEKNEEDEISKGDNESVSDSSTGTQTSFSRHSETEDPENNTIEDAASFSVAIAPINTVLFCVFRMAWMIIESSDDLCGLKHCTNESEEGYGEDRHAAATDSLNVNLSTEERQNVLQEQEKKRQCLLRKKKPLVNSQSAPMPVPAEYQSKKGSQHLSSVSADNANVKKDDHSASGAQGVGEKCVCSAALRQRWVHVQALVQEKLARVEIRRAAQLTVAVLAATLMTLVPALRQRLQYAYWVPVSVGFIAGTSAGSNVREGLVTLVGTALGSIFGYISLVIGGSRGWVVGSLFSLFNALCKYGAADTFSIYRRIFQIAAYTAPIIMFGADDAGTNKSASELSALVQAAALERMVHTVVGILLLFVVGQCILPIRAQDQLHSYSLEIMESLNRMLTHSLHSYIVVVYGAAEQNVSYGVTFPSTSNVGAVQTDTGLQSDQQAHHGEASTFKAPSIAASTVQNLTAVKNMLDVSRYISHFREHCFVSFVEATRIEVDPAYELEAKLEALKGTIPEASVEPTSWYRPNEETHDLHESFAKSIEECVRAITVVNQSRFSLIRNHSFQVQKLANREYSKSRDQVGNDGPPTEADVLSGLHLLLPFLPQIHRLQLSITETVQNILAVLHLISNLEQGNGDYTKEETMQKAFQHNQLAQQIRETGKACEAFDGNEAGDNTGAQKRSANNFESRRSLFVDISSVEPNITEERKSEVEYAKRVLWALERSSDSVSECLHSFQKLLSQFTEARIKETKEARLSHEIAEQEEEKEAGGGHQKAGTDIPWSSDQKTISSVHSAGSSPMRRAVSKLRLPSATQTCDTSAFEADCSDLPPDRQREERNCQGYDLGAGRGPSAFSNVLVLNINSVAFGLQRLSGSLSGLSSIAAKMYYSRLLCSTFLSQKPTNVSTELLRGMPWRISSQNKTEFAEGAQPSTYTSNADEQNSPRVPPC